MTTETRLQAILTAPPDKLAQVDGILSGEATRATDTDRRLFSMTQAAEALGVSRQTIWRMVKEKRLPTVEIRKGRYRIPSAAISALLQEAAV